MDTSDTEYVTIDQEDGKIYHGQARRGLDGSFIMHGRGAALRFDQGNERVLEGWFDNGKFSFRGRRLLIDGTCYDGEWNDDQYHGIGCFTWPDGAKNIGHFSLNKMEGKGTVVSTKGEIETGEYKNDKPIGIHLYTNVLEGRQRKRKWPESTFLD
jgi:hypothetical protein